MFLPITLILGRKNLAFSEGPVRITKGIRRRALKQRGWLVGWRTVLGRLLGVRLALGRDQASRGPARAARRRAFLRGNSRTTRGPTAKQRTGRGGGRG